MGCPLGALRWAEELIVVRVYRDRDDWWVGYYRGPRDHFVCLLPTLVIRWARRG